MPVGTPRAARRTRTLAGLDFEQRIFFNAHLCGLARESRGRAPHAPYPGDTRAHTWGQPKTPQRFWGDSREVRHARPVLADTLQAEPGPTALRSSAQERHSQDGRRPRPGSRLAHVRQEGA